MIERYVTARELAEVMGVSVSTIQRWTAAGMPSETWGMARTRRYRVSEAIAWAQARIEPAKADGAPTPLGITTKRGAANG